MLILCNVSSVAILFEIHEREADEPYIQVERDRLEHVIQYCFSFPPVSFADWMLDTFDSTSCSATCITAT